MCSLQLSLPTCSLLHEKYSKFDLIFTRPLRKSTITTVVHYEHATSPQRKLSSHVNVTLHDKQLESKMHAVCTVQVFRNEQTGLYLYLFSHYYLSLGYMVIVYDRYVIVMNCGG